MSIEAIRVATADFRGTFTGWVTKSTHLLMKVILSPQNPIKC